MKISRTWTEKTTTEQRGEKTRVHLEEPRSGIMIWWRLCRCSSSKHSKCRWTLYKLSNSKAMTINAFLEKYSKWFAACFCCDAIFNILLVLIPLFILVYVIMYIHVYIYIYMFIFPPLSYIIYHMNNIK